MEVRLLRQTMDVRLLRLVELQLTMALQLAIPEPTESLVGIEVKTRVTPHTAQDEFDRSTAPSGDHQVYEIVDAGDVSFTRRFRDQHEAVQVLHHAYC